MGRLIMAKTPHPADVAELAAIETASHFAVWLRHAGGVYRDEFPTLTIARAEARGLVAHLTESTGKPVLTKPLIYAVTEEGRSFLVPDTYQPANAQPPMEGDTMTITELAAQVETKTGTAAKFPNADVVATIDLTTGKTTVEERAPATTRYVSRAYNKRSNCTRAAAGHANVNGMTYPDDYTINDLGNGAFTFEVRVNADAAHEARGADRAKAEGRHYDDVTPAPDAGKAAMDGPDLTPRVEGSDIPKFLDRIGDHTNEEIETMRKAAIAKNAKRGIKAPGGKLKNPTGRKATGLGQAVGERKSAGAKPAKAATSNARTPTGERKRYDWNAAEANAKAGKLPAELDFSAETHKRSRGTLAEVTAAAKAGDVKALRAFDIPTYDSTVKALARYRDLCVVALKAKG